jgi:UDP-N-acetyl-2-amino-2-deoxyglucuronate dehydrogenase
MGTTDSCLPHQEKGKDGSVTPLRIGLVGCGKVAQIHVAALATIPEAELVATCDVDMERASSLASKVGAKPYASSNTMLKESKVDAIIIGTPHPEHIKSAAFALELGVHVLIEKPMAARLEECDFMLRIAARTGATLGVISQRRFYEPVMRMKHAIDAGRIGKPSLCVFQMYSWRSPEYYHSDPWRGKWDTEGGGVLVNQSPHPLDIMMWFMGPVAEVSGDWANINHPNVEVDDTAVATLRFANGGLGAVVTSVSQKPGIYSKIHVHGSNGASIGVETDRGSTFIAGVSGISEPPLNDLWTIAGEESKLAEFQTEDRQRFANLDATAFYHGLQIRDFVGAIRERRKPLVTGEDGRAVVELFTAIYRSAKERRAIKLPL